MSGRGSYPASFEQQSRHFHAAAAVARSEYEDRRAWGESVLAREAHRTVLVLAHVLVLVLVRSAAAPAAAAAAAAVCRHVCGA
eukprot:scaffold147753_cov14-Tisochrysis_lutea.AAC.1